MFKKLAKCQKKTISINDNKIQKIIILYKFKQKKLFYLFLIFFFVFFINFSVLVKNIQLFQRMSKSDKKPKGKFR